MGTAVEVVARFTAAFNARDIDAILELCEPDIEFHSTFAAVGGAVYHGHDGMRAWHRDFEETWAAIRSEVGKIFDLGDAVIIQTTIIGRGRKSGLDADLPAWMVVRLRDDRIASFRAFIHREDALAELGATEADLRVSS